MAVTSGGARSGALYSLLWALAVAAGLSAKGGGLVLGKAVPARLVEAECTAVEEHARGAKATFAIRRTYAVGKDERDPRTFMESYDKYGGSMGAGTWPPPKVGDIGLWAVEANDEGVWYASGRFPFDMAWPIMASDKAQYALATAFAEAVGDIAGRGQADQLRALHRAALGRNPLLACWAVSCLAKSPGIAESELADVADKCGTLCFEAQTVLDEALARAWGKRWTNAGKRIDMLKGWTTREALECCHSRGFTRLADAYGDGELAPTLFFGLIGSAAADTTLPAEAREHALWLLGRMSPWREGEDRDKALAAVLLVLRSKEDSTDLRRRAAKSLEHFFRLSPVERKAVQELRDATSDAELAKILTRVLEKKTE